MDVGAVDRHHPVRRVGPERHRCVVGVHHADPYGVARLGRHPEITVHTVDGRGSPRTCGPWRARRADRSAGPGQDDQSAEEPATHLRIGHLMRVVPEAAGPLRDEPVGELTPDRHRVLGDAGDPVHGVGHVHPVPVQAHALGHRLVDQVHLDQLTLDGGDGRTRRGAVQGETRDCWPPNSSGAAGASGRPVRQRRRLDDHVGDRAHRMTGVGPAPCPAWPATTDRAGRRRRSRDSPCPSPSTPTAPGWTATATPGERRSPAWRAPAARPAAPAGCRPSRHYGVGGDGNGRSSHRRRRYAPQAAQQPTAAAAARSRLPV